MILAESQAGLPGVAAAGLAIFGWGTMWETEGFGLPWEIQKHPRRRLAKQEDRNVAGRLEGGFIYSCRHSGEVLKMLSWALPFPGGAT